MRRPTTIKPRPTTLKRPTTIVSKCEQSENLPFDEVMQKAYRGIHEGPQLVCQTEDGTYYVGLISEWMKTPVGQPICQIHKTEAGMRVGSLKIFSEKP